MTSGVDPIVINLIVFVLAIFVGYHVVWGVTPALHTPLMSLTNAISSIILVGAMLAAGAADLDWRVSCAAVTLVSIHVFGGFRLSACSTCSRRRNPKPAWPRSRLKGRLGDFMSANQLALWYLVAAVNPRAQGLSRPWRARYGMTGMAITADHAGAVYCIAPAHFGGMAVGGTIGAIVARRVQMTQMPELVAAMHSLVGLAAVFIAVAAVNNPAAMGLDVPITFGHKLELFIGTFIGAITFSGSVIAFGKLSGRIRSAPVTFKGQHFVNLAIGIAMIAFGIWFCIAPPSAQWMPFIVMTALAFLLGFLLIIPIGGADMPVVISMLNSYSGWAAAGIGFSLDNPMLIIAGSLVGSSGAILSYIMCKAMNRSFFSVIWARREIEGRARKKKAVKTVPTPRFFCPMPTR
jgi:hypothetical protein